MKNVQHLLTLMMLSLAGQIAAQGGLLLTGGVKMVCDGAVEVVVENGKFKNTSSTFTRGASTLKFMGNATTSKSVIEGSNTTFHNIEIAKSQNDLRLLASNTSVMGELIFTREYLDLNGKVLTLGSSTVDAELKDEINERRTYGKNVASRVVKTWPLNSPHEFNFGAMGITISASGNYGNGTIERRHGSYNLPNGKSIYKHWRVSTTASPALQSVHLTLEYFDGELNGLNEADLTIWRSTNNGATWTDMGRSSNSTTLNYVLQKNMTDLSGWWTLSVGTPLHDPVEERLADQPNTLEPLEWTIYPNPVTTTANIQITAETAEKLTIEIVGVDGKVMQRKVVGTQIGVHTYPIQVQSLPAGTYFARILGQPYLPISLIKI